MKEFCLYILGAGASAADEAPTMGEIIDRAFWKFGGRSTSSNIRVMGAWQNRDDLKAFEETFCLMDHFYGTNLKQKMDGRYQTLVHPTGLDNIIDIEGFFTRLDKMLKREESYGLNLTKTKIEEIYEKAAFFFYHTLCWETTQEGVYAPPEHYSTFVENALTPDRGHCIISFNYDMLLEAAMYNPNKYLQNQYKNPLFNQSYFPDKRFSWTYGMNFSHIYCHEPYSVRDEETAIIRYFKLHGSFNWGFCPESKETFMYYPGPNLCAYKEFHYGKEQCHGGKHCVRPLLIPPKMEKNIEIPGLREIWRKARYFLEGTQEVHILGYSLPRADEGAKQLLSTTLNRPLKRLIIANPDKNHRERLRGILSSDIVDYREYESFEDYLNKQSGIKFN